MILRYFYRLPWLQSEWTPLGYRLMWVYLLNMSEPRPLYPMRRK